MPTLDPPFYLMTDGAPVDVEVFNEFLYAPSRTDSLHIVNGRLDADNLKTGIAVEQSKARPKSCIGAKIEGLTGNFDFHGNKVFPKKHTNKDAYVPLPGACLSFFIPNPQPKVVIITWQVFGANATMFERVETEEKLTRMRFHVNGTSTEGTRYIPSSRHGHNGYNPTTETYGDARPQRAYRRPHRDRVWSGHFSEDLPAGVGVVKQGWNHAWVGVHNEDQTARFRVRNMKVVWFY